MKLEKRSTGSDVTSDLPEEQGRHPVVIYIVLLFLVAFLLMVISLVMQHRSSQAMGRLEDSVSALQETQEVREENLRLRQELEEALAQQQELQQQLNDSRDARIDLETELTQQEKYSRAMALLYRLQQQFSAREYEACEKTIAAMEEDELAQFLPQDDEDPDITPPAQRYQQLKTAVEQR